MKSEENTVYTCIKRNTTQKQENMKRLENG